MKVFFYTVILLLQVGFFSNESKAQEVGANIILNPSFDVNDAGWDHYFDYSWDPTNPLAAKASLSVEPKAGYIGNAYKVTITNAGTADYSVQISYPVALEAGKKYSIKFKASADAARTVVLACQQDVSPKTNWYISSPINLTTTPTVLGPYYYTATTSDPSNLFKFYLGGGGTANGISAYFDDVEVAEVIDVIGATVPDPPTNVVAVPGSFKAFVSFTAPINTGGLNMKSYTVTASPGGIQATGSSSPIKVSGLTNGTAYTFTVFATNALGNSVATAPSNSVTPVFAPDLYYVSPSGNDNNDGLSVNAPFATIDKAHATAIAGDTIYLMTGNYPPFKITKGGNASGDITYKKYPGDNPVITCDLNGWWSLIQVSASYITIDGLEVKGINDQITLAMAEANYNKIDAAIQAGTTPDYQSTTNTNTNGISIGDNTGVYHHVTVKNCKIHDVSAGGLGGGNADYFLFENNEIYNTSWYCMWATSGISVINLISIDAGSNMVFRGNRVYNNYSLVKWISIRALSDGNGIIIDVTNGTDHNNPIAYKGKFIVENNVVFDNGGRGLYVIESENAIFRNNISYWNSKSPFSDGGEMVVYAAKNITYVNNIAWANPAYSSGNFGIRDDGNWKTNSNITWKNNISFNGTVGDPSVRLAKTSTTAIDNTNKLGVNPLFVNPTIDPATADFRLQPTSPAIDAGTAAYGVPAFDIEYAARTQGNGIDIGSYESVDITLPLSLLNFTAKRINASAVILNWNTTQEISFDFFELERANDSRSFEKIAIIKSGGASKNNYQYTDKNTVSGYSYYRLKMIDKDGRFTYSNVVAIANGVNENTVSEVYPNPVSNSFATIDIIAKENGEWSVSAANIAGRTVKLQNAVLIKGTNKVKIDLTTLAAGIYFLKIENNGQSFIKKVVKN